MSADGNGRPWDWADDADDVIVAKQPPVACYINSADAIVLRQPAAEHDEDDAVIWFNLEHAPAIAAAILYAAGYQASALAPKPTQGDGKAKDATGAERQRRRRARQKEPTLDIDRDADRDADRDSSRAGRVTETVTRHGEEG